MRQAAFFKKDGTIQIEEAAALSGVLLANWLEKKHPDLIRDSFTVVVNMHGHYTDKYLCYQDGTLLP